MFKIKIPFKLGLKTKKVTDWTDFQTPTQKQYLKEHGAPKSLKPEDVKEWYRRIGLDLSKCRKL